MLNEYVADARAKIGGQCPECGMNIGVGNAIYKYSRVGDTTQAGNGPGVWVCGWCHNKAQLPPTQEERLDIEPFVCSMCHQEVNPVVVRCGLVRCFDCDAGIP